MSQPTPYGRWDVTVHHPDGDFPSWFELTPTGGQFVGMFGSARPIERLTLEGDQVDFELPPQYEPRKDPMRFVGTLDDRVIHGETTHWDGTPMLFTAKPAPIFDPEFVPEWGEPVDLIAAGLDAWRPRGKGENFNWTISNGVLDNSKTGEDIVLKAAHHDFKLVAEYCYPKDSNSGIYLRGRYEMQILDDYGAEPSVGSSGAIYGFLEPSENAVKPFGEWNRAEIELVGRTVTIVLNGVTILDHEEIHGITGGALDAEEGSRGHLFLQGDHGPVSFRKLELTAAV